MQPTLFKRLLFATALLTSSGLVFAGELTVSAASSLTNAFKEIAQSYQQRYPDAKIALNFGASGALLQQLAKGAPVDVFASADQETMDIARKQGLIAPADRHDFVRNRLVLIVPNDSSVAIKRLQDLDQPGIRRIAIGNPASVPVGRYTRHALEAASLWKTVEGRMIRTQNVRQALDYVARGEVDAGFVYATDAALMADKVRVVAEIPAATDIRYPIAKTVGNANDAEARRFIDFVLAPAAQEILAKFGFRKL
ncbi:molybdate ABC transporter substrate-binding protein [Actimicrobium antarcticum]|uniref:Molybdate ABC transporter substrate-binding protein n=1 Tax=Actimicrobium antarcticum TaxID=1051899 RepID=A0ABP7SI28_9BURK